MRMNSRFGFRIVLSLIGLATFTVLATGCSLLSTPMTRSDVLGLWEAREGQHVLQIELSGDGASTVSGLPAAVVATDRPAKLSWEDTIDSTGHWSFWTPGADIDVSLSDAAREGIYGSVRLNPQGSELVVYYGDIDFPSHLTLTRVQAPSTPPRGPLFPRTSLARGRQETMAISN